MKCKIPCAVARICFFLMVITVPSTIIEGQTIQRTQWERDVRRQLRASASALADYDVVPSHEVVVDTLETGYYQDIEYDLEAGVRYFLVGACDRDCSSLGLKLYDDNWNVVATDGEDQDHPSLAIVVRRSATFHLRVFMQECDQNPCWWGAGVYKPSGD